MTPTAAAFETFCRRKADAAQAAGLRPMATTAADMTGADLVPIGTAWTRALFDGAFYRSAAAGRPALPAVSLVVGVTDTDHIVTGELLLRTSDETSRHLIHEGLARVEADAVLGSVASLRGPEALCSVWHPEFVQMRRARGLDRHPAQVIVTSTGDLPDDSFVLAEPSLRVIVVTRNSVAPWLSARMRSRPWVQVIEAGEPLSLFVALTRLRGLGIGVVAAVGGQQTASALLRQGLVSDLYVARPAGADAGSLTRLCDGPALPRHRLLSKAASGDRPGVRFEHLVRPSTVAAASLRGAA